MKRAQGTGTVQFHNGRFRLRLPRSLDPTRSWLGETFRADQEAEAHAFMDKLLVEARSRVAARDRVDGLTLASAWPKYVAHVARVAERRHVDSGRNARARLDGMGDRWLKPSPFWEQPLDTIQGIDIERWLSDVQLTGKSAKGERISDSWVAQCAASIRGVFRMLKRPCPAFELDIEHQKVTSALNLSAQERFLQDVVTDPRDRVMVGCQLGAGLRVGELLSLTIDRVDLGPTPHLMLTTGGPNGAPTKSGKPRRVELFEPGLGFFKLAVEQHYRPNDRGLLFAGPLGGYLGQWGEKFVAWSKAFGSHVTTHDLRHSWAFSMLSGLWGYAPLDITFVSGQLGHTDIRTTQKSYGHWDPGAGLVTARILRGEQPAVADPVTARRLLGLDIGACSPRRSPLSLGNPDKRGNWVSDGSSSNPPISSGFLPDVAHFVAHEAAVALCQAALGDADPSPAAESFLRAMGDDVRALKVLVLLFEGSPFAIRQACDLAIEVIRARQPGGERQIG